MRRYYRRSDKELDSRFRGNDHEQAYTEVNSPKHYLKVYILFPW